jgi:broad specificity phosphatase PhoE
MNRPKLFVLLRHAESLRNRAKAGGNIYYPDDGARRYVKGIPDYKIDLTPEGIIQAEKTGTALYERFGRFDYAYHSGYLRTKKTLENVLKMFPDKEREKTKVRMNFLIRERHAGYTYDMTTKEAEATFPYLKDYWATFGPFSAQPPGGESIDMLTVRINLFLDMIFKSRAGEKVLVVTHGGPNRSFRFLLEHWDYDQAVAWPEGESPKNCSLTVYEYCSSEKRLVLKDYNTIYY